MCRSGFFGGQKTSINPGPNAEYSINRGCCFEFVKLSIFNAKENSIFEIFEKEISEEGLKRLDSFYINPKSKEFYDFIEDIFWRFEELGDLETRPENKLRDSIEKSFLEIQNHLK